MALAAGDTIDYDTNTPSGSTLEAHTINQTTLGKISQRDWDFVVLQEQSQRPSFPPGQVANEVYPYAEILVDSIRSNHECTEPVFYMTWGRRAGDQQNCQFYPPLCTFAGMQQRLRESYTEMAIDNNARIAPCGPSWARMEVVDTTFFNGLYTGDGSHPSAWGQYLNACVFYATLFHKSPVGIPYYSSIGQTDAETLQALAEEVMLDSLETWNSFVNLPVAGFDHNSDGTNVTFVNNSMNNEEDIWHLGDGTVSSDENPVHDYPGSGNYNVMYIAGNGCGDFDTTTVTITLTSTGISEEDGHFRSIQTFGNGRFQLVFESEVHGTIRVSDLSGSLLREEKLNSNSVIVNLQEFPRATYLIQIIGSDGSVATAKLIW